MKIRKLRAVQTRRVLSAAAEWTRISRTFSICPCKLQLPERIRAILRQLFLDRRVEKALHRDQILAQTVQFGFSPWVAIQF